MKLSPISMAKETEAASEKTTVTTGRRKLYYISAEFLIGKLLSNNLINLGLYDEIKKELAAAGKSLAEIEELEPELKSRVLQALGGEE